MAIVTAKFCSKCKIEKSIIEFSKNSCNKDKLQTYCKICISLYSRKNKNKISSYQKEYRDNNKEKAIKYSKIYRTNNKEELSSKKKIYRNSNKEIIRKKKNEYERNKNKSDPAFKLRKKISLFTRIALNGNKSNFSILQYLPYTINDLKEYLEKQFEPWMSWSNWGKYNPKIWNDNDTSTWTWQLDHIIPQVFLPYSNMEDENFKKCWALNNLRPLSAKQNVIEGSKLRSSNV